MFKYVLKRIGYMFLVLFILSIVIFMIYNLTPSNRAYTDAKADQVAMKQQLAGLSAEQQAEWFDKQTIPSMARKASSTAFCRATSAIPISTKKM